MRMVAEIKVEIDPELNQRLTALCTHKGHRSLILRTAIRKEVELREGKKRVGKEEEVSET